MVKKRDWKPILYAAIAITLMFIISFTEGALLFPVIILALSIYAITKISQNTSDTKTTHESRELHNGWKTAFWIVFILLIICVGLLFASREEFSYYKANNDCFDRNLDVVCYPGGKICNDGHKPMCINQNIYHELNIALSKYGQVSDMIKFLSLIG